MDNPNQTEPTRWARGGSQSDLRRHNERTVLSAVDRHPGLFNAELARRTGLAAQTISVILKSLQDQNLIVRGPVLRGRRGQPATPIFLNPHGAYGLGVDIGLRRMALARVDFSGTITGEQIWRHPYPDPETTLDKIVTWVRALRETGPRRIRNDAISLGVATPKGLLDGVAVGGMAKDCATQWARMDLKILLESQLQMPVMVIDGGTAACGAQIRDKDHPPDFAYLHIGATLVSGIVLGGHVHAGREGQMPDFGAIALPGAHGDAATAGELLSIVALETWQAGRGISVPGGLDADSAMGNYGDALDAWIAQAAPVLAHLIVTIEAVVALGAILIDSDLPAAVLDALVVAARHEMRVRDPLARRHPAVHCGTLGDTAVVLGAARAPLHRAYFSSHDGVARQD